MYSIKPMVAQRLKAVENRINQIQTEGQADPQVLEVSKEEAAFLQWLLKEISQYY
jgi:hypothetical protein